MSCQLSARPRPRAAGAGAHNDTRCDLVGSRVRLVSRGVTHARALLVVGSSGTCNSRLETSHISGRGCFLWNLTLVTWTRDTPRPTLQIISKRNSIQFLGMHTQCGGSRSRGSAPPAEGSCERGIGRYFISPTCSAGYMSLSMHSLTPAALIFAKRSAGGVRKPMGWT